MSKRVHRYLLLVLCCYWALAVLFLTVVIGHSIVFADTVVILSWSDVKVLLWLTFAGLFFGLAAIIVLLRTKVITYGN